MEAVIEVLQLSQNHNDEPFCEMLMCSLKNAAVHQAVRIQDTCAGSKRSVLPFSTETRLDTVSREAKTPETL